MLLGGAVLSWFDGHEGNSFNRHPTVSWGGESANKAVLEADSVMKEISVDIPGCARAQCTNECLGKAEKGPKEAKKWKGETESKVRAH